MRWAKMGLYVYIAQAATGAAIGVTIVLVQMIGH
jgi:hypothetical protein